MRLKKSVFILLGLAMSACGAEGMPGGPAGDEKISDAANEVAQGLQSDPFSAVLNTRPLHDVGGSVSAPWLLDDGKKSDSVKFTVTAQSWSPSWGDTISFVNGGSDPITLKAGAIITVHCAFGESSSAKFSASDTKIAPRSSTNRLNSLFACPSNDSDDYITYFEISAHITF